jgi:hypothetical protein
MVNQQVQKEVTQAFEDNFVAPVNKAVAAVARPSLRHQVGAAPTVMQIAAAAGELASRELPLPSDGPSVLVAAPATREILAEHRKRQQQEAGSKDGVLQGELKSAAPALVWSASRAGVGRASSAVPQAAAAAQEPNVAQAQHRTAPDTDKASLQTGQDDDFTFPTTSRPLELLPPLPLFPAFMRPGNDRGPHGANQSRDASEATASAEAEPFMAPDHNTLARQEARIDSQHALPTTRADQLAQATPGSHRPVATAEQLQPPCSDLADEPCHGSATGHPSAMQPTQSPPLQPIDITHAGPGTCDSIPEPPEHLSGLSRSLGGAEGVDGGAVPDGMATAAAAAVINAEPFDAPSPRQAATSMPVQGDAGGDGDDDDHGSVVDAALEEALDRELAAMQRQLGIVPAVVPLAELSEAPGAAAASVAAVAGTMESQVRVRHLGTDGCYPGCLHSKPQHGTARCTQVSAQPACRFSAQALALSCRRRTAPMALCQALGTCQISTTCWPSSWAAYQAARERAAHLPGHSACPLRRPLWAQERTRTV